MEEKINIAAILKDKPNGIRLYSPIFGECSFSLVREETYDICVKKHNGVKEFFDYKGLYYNTGEVMLFPSKSMRDWEKLSWKKGDVLSCGVDNICIFDKWENEEYTEFYAKFVTPNYSGNTFKTEKWSKETNEAVIKQYISNIEEFKGGKLNLTTLEIEKAQPEFKDGDIVCISGMGYLAYGIVKSIDNSSKKLEYYVLNDMSILKFEDWLSFEDKQIQPITETQQIILFDALARENKAWDAEKIQIVDLKPKVKLKPFDKVIVRCSKADKWSIDFFSYKVSNGYICTGDAWFGYCLPYNDETSHLLGTTDEWKGGEG